MTNYAKNGLPQQTTYERKLDKEATEHIAIIHERNKNEKKMTLSEIAKMNKEVLENLDNTATDYNPVYSEEYKRRVKEANERIEKERNDRFKAAVRANFYPAENEISYDDMVLSKRFR